MLASEFVQVIDGVSGGQHIIGQSWGANTGGDTSNMVPYLNKGSSVNRLTSGDIEWFGLGDKASRDRKSGHAIDLRFRIIIKLRIIFLLIFRFSLIISTSDT